MIVNGRVMPRPSVEIAVGKAKSAATYRRPTRAFMDVINKGGPATATLPGVFASPGGVPIMVDGKLWVVDDRAKLKIIDPATGDVLKTKGLGSSMHSTPLVADGKVYVCTISGRCVSAFSANCSSLR